MLLEQQMHAAESSAGTTLPSVGVLQYGTAHLSLCLGRDAQVIRKYPDHQEGRTASTTSIIELTPYLLASQNLKVVMPFGRMTQ